MTFVPAFVFIECNFLAKVKNSADFIGNYLELYNLWSPISEHVLGRTVKEWVKSPGKRVKCPTDALIHDHRRTGLLLF